MSTPGAYEPLDFGSWEPALFWLGWIGLVALILVVVL